VVAAEVSDYMTRVTPTAQYIWAWDTWFSAAWAKAATAEGQAALLHQLGNRIAQACGAYAAITNVPVEAAGIDTLVREAARVRHAWAQAAVEQLQCCGKVVSEEIAAGNVSTSSAVSGVLPALQQFGADYGAVALEGFGLSHSALAVGVQVLPGWLASADGLTMVFVAPFHFQAAGLAGLGPEVWQKGTGVTVRRLRNPDLLTPAEASERFSGLVTGQGSVESTEEVQLSGFPALRHQLAAGEGWLATVTVTVAGDFTYFIETGCVTGVSGSCEEVERLVNGLTIGG
jgi:hypothetical protein